MSRKALVFQHMHDDDLCYFDDLLRGDGYAIDTAHLYRDEAIPSLADYDLLMVLGGPMDVWQTDEHPWLIPETEAVAEWVGERAKPYIGICLGHQLLALALGGEVSNAEKAEVGLHYVDIPETETHPFLAGLGGRQPVMQWHHAEVSKVPSQAEVLASSPLTKVQSLAVDNHALGVQFHFEWTLERIRNWPSGLAGCTSS